MELEDKVRVSQENYVDREQMYGNNNKNYYRTLK